MLMPTFNFNVSMNFLASEMRKLNAPGNKQANEMNNK